MFELMLAVALCVVVAILWLPIVSELLCLFNRRRPVRMPDPSLEKPPRLLFLVPAHDEELLIAGCLRSLLQMTYPATHRRVVVIADNCSDGTAGLARNEGVECFERVDPTLPGKPRAIAWMLEQIDLTEWDACVIVDADSTVAPGFALGVAALAPLNDIVFQPNNGVLNEFENWLTRLGGLLGRSRFEVSYPRKQSAGLTLPLGNGLGIGTNLLIRDGWRSYSITEDTELYAIYTESGVSIRQARAADIFSQESRSLGEGAIQRRRWIAGRFRILREWGPRLVRSPNIGWRQKLDALVELALPAPVLHLLAASAVVVAALVGVRGTLGWSVASLAVASLSAIAVNTLIAIGRHPEPWRTAASFIMLPVYAGWRLVVMLGTLVTVRDTTWRRTSRASPAAGVAFPMTDPRT